MALRLHAVGESSSDSMRPRSASLGHDPSLVPEEDEGGEGEGARDDGAALGRARALTGATPAKRRLRLFRRSVSVEGTSAVSRNE